MQQGNLDVSGRKARRRFFAFYELPLAAKPANMGVEHTRGAKHAAVRKQKRTEFPNALGGPALAESSGNLFY
jgi:hypothetical protein